MDNQSFRPDRWMACMRLLDISKRVLKDTKRMPAKHLKQVKRCILALMQNPMPQDAIKVGEDEGRALYRVDVGEYRLVYYYDDSTVYLLLCGKRNDAEVYKKLGRIA